MIFESQRQDASKVERQEMVDGPGLYKTKHQVKTDRSLHGRHGTTVSVDNKVFCMTLTLYEKVKSCCATSQPLSMDSVSRCRSGKGFKALLCLEAYGTFVFIRWPPSTQVIKHLY